jgi:hypothetical protein
MVPLFAVLTAAAPSPALDQTPSQPLETVYDFAANDRGLSVQLSGCGDYKSQFSVTISRSADPPVVRIHRRVRSASSMSTMSLVGCGARVYRPGAWSSPSTKPSRWPNTTIITWTWAELGLRPGEAFDLANPPPAADGPMIRDLDRTPRGPGRVP